MIIEIFDGLWPGTYLPGYRVENPKWGTVGRFDCDTDDALICQIVAYSTGRNVAHTLHAGQRFGHVFQRVTIDGKHAKMAEVVGLLADRKVDVTALHYLPQCECRKIRSGYFGAVCIVGEAA